MTAAHPQPLRPRPAHPYRTPPNPPNPPNKEPQP